nr:MAG TPA: hypothetical protein [Caudoviricetes sp.]
MINGGHPRNKKDAGVCKALGARSSVLNCLRLFAVHGYITHGMLALSDILDEILMKFHLNLCYRSLSLSEILSYRLRR